MSWHCKVFRVGGYSPLNETNPHKLENELELRTEVLAFLNQENPNQADVKITETYQTQPVGLFSNKTQHVITVWYRK